MLLSLKSTKRMRSSSEYGTAWRAGIYMSESGICKTTLTSTRNPSPSMDPNATTYDETIAMLGQEA
jgi:hypothetical protein